MKKFNVTVQWFDTASRSTQVREYNIRVSGNEAYSYSEEIWVAKHKAIRKAQKESTYPLNINTNIIKFVKA